MSCVDLQKSLSRNNKKIFFNKSHVLIINEYLCIRKYFRCGSCNDSFNRFAGIFDLPLIIALSHCVNSLLSWLHISHLEAGRQISRIDDIQTIVKIIGGEIVFECTQIEFVAEIMRQNCVYRILTET